MSSVPIFNLDLKDFQGSLEGLYDKIRDNEIDLSSLNLEHIIAQYKSYIEECLIAKYNLNFFCNQLTLCSKLLLLRSQLALPEPVLEMEQDDIFQKEDERIKNLLRYNRIKQLAQQLKILQKENVGFLGKEASPYDLDDNKNNSKNDPVDYFNKLDINHLTEAFLRMIERINYEKPLLTKVVKQNTSPYAMKKQIIKYCQNGAIQKWSFEKFLMIFSTNMSSLITCFLVILDLIANQVLQIKVEKQNIFLKYIKINNK